MFNRWFLHDGLLLSLPIPVHYSAALVVLSYLVAAFGAYTSFQLIERVQAALTARARRAWLVTAGFAMGCGIWAMHFIAMLAVEMPMHVVYDVWTTIVSAACAVFASCVAFSLIADNFHRRHRLFLAGFILGAGIAAMHYIGMAAIPTPDCETANAAVAACAQSIRCSGISWKPRLRLALVFPHRLHRPDRARVPDRFARGDLAPPAGAAGLGAPPRQHPPAVERHRTQDRPAQRGFYFRRVTPSARRPCVRPAPSRRRPSRQTSGKCRQPSPA